MSTFFIGIDPSLCNTGVSICDYTGKLLDCRTISPKSKGVERLHTINSELYDIFEEFKITGEEFDTAFICSEAPSYASKSASLLEIGELFGALQLLFYERHYSYVFVSPKSIKKFFTGKGSADKIDMRMTADSKFGVSRSKNMTEHEIDAMAANKFGFSLYNNLIGNSLSTNDESIKLYEKKCLAHFDQTLSNSKVKKLGNLKFYLNSHHSETMTKLLQVKKTLSGDLSNNVKNSRKRHKAST